MATYTVRVSQNVGKDSRPYILNQDETSCFTNKTIRVPVPAGESRYVDISYSADFSFQDQTATISTTTDYVLILDAVRDEITEANNTGFGSGYIRVSLTNSTPTFYSSGITRTYQEPKTNC